MTGLPLQKSPVVFGKRVIYHFSFLLLDYIMYYSLRVQIYPVTSYIDSHAQLKPESISRIEQA